MDGLAMFGAVSVEKLLAQSQKQLDKLQNKTTQTPADKAKVAGLLAQIQVLQGGGTTAQAKQAYRDTETKAKDAAKPPIIPALPELPPEPETNYRPWLIGGAVVVGGLALLAFLMNRKQK